MSESDPVTAAPTRGVHRALPWLAVVMAACAIALHSPGHVSMDTSVQLYEASVGTSVSWNPPFMSALLRWLGGGEVALAALVMISSLLTYLSMGGVAGAGLAAEAAKGRRPFTGARTLACALILFNPVLLIYLGIVWKDVLFASVLTAGVALALVATHARLGNAIALACVSALLFGLALQIRQQGIFMAPLLLLLAVLAATSGRGWPFKGRALVAGLVVATFLLTIVVSKSLVAGTITEAGDRSSSVGFRSIMVYDMAGIVANRSSPDTEWPVSVSVAEHEAITRVYTPQRIDTLMSDPVAWQWISGIPEDDSAAAWWAMIRAEPKAFLSHRGQAYLALLNWSGVQGCLPVHIGVSGNSEYLRTLRIPEVSDNRDLFVWDLASGYFDSFVYRHWFYLGMLLLGILCLCVLGMDGTVRRQAAVLALAIGLYYLSFLPTSIACDFRYLYGAIPLVSLLWILILSHGRLPSPKAGGTA